MIIIRLVIIVKSILLGALIEMYVVERTFHMAGYLAHCIRTFSSRRTMESPIKQTSLLDVFDSAMFRAWFLDQPGV